MNFFQKICIKHSFVGFCFLFLCSKSISQSCPTNIDFENGSFSNWTCLAGFVQTSGTQNIINLSPTSGPIANRHEIISRTAAAGAIDPFGNFPVGCPNGSGYSVKLGNTSGGHEAEGVQYQFTIPANRNTFSLVYYYAVVFENPNHQIHQQPRLEIEVKNVTDNNTINCSSFTFIPFGSPLPGFYVSPVSDSIMCKAWTPVTINLNGNAGKTISLTFKTADCTFNRHFGYAYVDVNTECSGEFSGAAYCSDDTAVNVVGPYGFQSYKWYDQTFTTLLGTGQNLFLQPPPPTGSLLAVEVTPYNGYGCVDTMYAIMEDTLHLKANAGSDVLLCGSGSYAVLGENPKTGVVYEWTPATDLSSPIISNPVASPAITTQYILNIRNGGGGCKSADTVKVTKSLIDSTLLFLGKNEFCITSQDSAVMYVQPGYNVKWIKDGSIISGENKIRYQAKQSGNYYAQLTNSDGCIANTRNEIVYIETPAPGITYPVEFALKNNPIILTARDFKGSTLWQPPIYLDDATKVQVNFESPTETELTYKINIISRAGCATTDYQPVKVIKEIKIYMPTAFTPNNDGLNDYIYPISIGAKINVFKIFNRWGRQVFSIEQSDKGWDGIYKGVPQEMGTYVWFLQSTGIDKKPYNQKGSFILIR